YSDRPTDVRIKLGDLKDPLSKDEFYARTERPKGILRWEINVAAGATGEKVRIVDYGFTLDFDRNLALHIPGAGVEEGQPAAARAEGMGGGGMGGGMGMGGTGGRMQQEFEMQQRAKLTK